MSQRSFVRLLPAVFLVSLIAACGGDDDPCPKEGCADTGGVVFGVDSEEVAFAETRTRSALGTEFAEVFLSRHGEFCSADNNNGLVITFTLSCPEVGMHTVVDSDMIPEDCGVLANAYNDGNAVAKATAGNVNVLEVVDGVIEGNFDLTFQGGWIGVGEATESPGGITGEFKAAPCGG